MKKNHLLLAVALILLVAACKNSSEFKVATNADTVSIQADTTQAKLVKTAGITFKVKDVIMASRNITALTKKYGGMVIHQNITSNVNQSQDVHIGNDSVIRVSSVSSSADIVAKVPTVDLDEFLDNVSKDGIYVAEKKFDIEDKTFDYLSAAMKLKSRNSIISQQKSGKVIIKDPSAVLWLKDDMIDQKINNLKIDDAVKYSTVNLKCYQSNIISKEVIANDDPSAYKAPFLIRIKMAVINGYYIFQKLLLVIINLWMIIFIALLTWFAYRHYKNAKNAPIINTQE